MKRIYTSFFLTVILTALCFSFSANAVDLSTPIIKSKKTTSNTATIVWSEVSNANGYKIYQKNTQGSFTALKSTSKTEYTVSNLSSDTSYEFRIRAYVKDKNGKKTFGPYSEIVSLKTKLDDVKNLSFKSAQKNSITVKWDEVSSATHYKVYYGVCGKDGYKLAGTTDKTTLKIENLEENTRYKIKVMAKSDSNSSSYSQLIKLYTALGKANKPQVEKKDSTSVTLKWAKTKNANLYYIYVSSSPDGKYKKKGETQKTSYTYIKKTPEKAYYFKIVPVVKNSYQTMKGQASNYKKASIGKITISVPETVRKGEYPQITVPNYTSKIKWSSSNSSVIKVKNNRLFAVKEGTATITAVYNKKHKASISVTVSPPVLKYMSAVYDVSADEYVFESRINERCYPASITKLITALVCLKYMDLNDVIVVGNELNMVEALSSRCNIQRGEKFKLKDILYGLLLPSGGDAAYTLAVNCARKVSGNSNMGYVEAKNYFVSLMNNYMKSIGATGTHCVNPHGYPVDGHYSSVHDLVLVAKEVLKNDTLKKITSTPYKYVTSLTGQGHSWSTTNSLIVSYAYYYSKYAHGMKTGTVNDNYTGIVSAATKDGRTIITVVIGCESYNARYEATHKLYRTYLY